MLLSLRFPRAEGYQHALKHVADECEWKCLSGGIVEVKSGADRNLQSRVRPGSLNGVEGADLVPAAVGIFEDLSPIRSRGQPVAEIVVGISKRVGDQRKSGRQCQMDIANRVHGKDVARRGLQSEELLPLRWIHH